MSLEVKIAKLRENLSRQKNFAMRSIDAAMLARLEKQLADESK